MEKKSTIIKNWSLYVSDEDEYFLSGTCEYHPAYGKKAYIRSTSRLVNYTFEDDVLTFETLNTIYIAPIKYMAEHAYSDHILSDIVEKVHRSEASPSSLDLIISASAQQTIEYLKQHPGWRESEILEGKYPEFQSDYTSDAFLKHLEKLQEIGQKELKDEQEAEERRLIDIAKQYDDCVYLEVSCISLGDVLAYHIGNNTGVIYPSVHVGTFQDSVLYTPDFSADSPFLIDFRYFPKYMGIETYSWSDNIKRAIIKNEKPVPISFNHVTIDPGETKIFTEDTHHQGLISPDFFNGKSVLFPKKDKNK